MKTDEIIKLAMDFGLVDKPDNTDDYYVKGDTSELLEFCLALIIKIRGEYES